MFFSVSYSFFAFLCLSLSLSFCLSSDTSSLLYYPCIWLILFSYIFLLSLFFCFSLSSLLFVYPYIPVLPLIRYTEKPDLQSRLHIFMQRILCLVQNLTKSYRIIPPLSKCEQRYFSRHFWKQALISWMTETLNKNIIPRSHTNNSMFFFLSAWLSHYVFWCIH